MEKISYEAFKAKVIDPDVPDAEIARYLTADREKSGPFDPRIVPDPDKVEMTKVGDADVESAIRWGNAMCRFRRKLRFEQAQSDGRPVLISEGDSWFQFPFLIEDVIDQMEPHYRIWSLDAAGDTADNMVNRKPEYKAGLDAQKANGVRAFLFSAAGNDVIGEDLNGVPVLSSLIKPFTPGKDAAWHIDQGRYAQVLEQLRTDYCKVVATVRNDPDFAKLPIVIHGYDYAIPGGFPGDMRHPIYAKQNEWLGGPLAEKGITDVTMQRKMIRLLIDGLYDMLDHVASGAKGVHVVDVRGALEEGDWADEIHATDAGFARVARRFRKVIDAVL